VGLLATTGAVGQSVRSKSDADIDLIGNRRVAREPNVYSPAREIELGNTLAATIEKSSKFINDDAVTAYVNGVAQKVEQNSDKHTGITIKLIDSEESKSFTLPGGHQYITKGMLLRLQNEGELASALARGIAHTALRSNTRLATLAGTAVWIEPYPVKVPVYENSARQTSALVKLKERRDSELDADYFGIQYLYKSGYDTKCFLDFVALATDGGKNVPAILGTDPPLPQRLTLLEKEITKILPKRDGAVISTTEFQEFKNRIQTLKPGIIPSELTTKSN
jgi:predicted Zn-dependent protease